MLGVQGALDKVDVGFNYSAEEGWYRGQEAECQGSILNLKRMVQTQECCALPE